MENLKEREIRPKEFYYTNEQMVKNLLAITPLEYNDNVLDAGSGQNKVWYNNIPKDCIKYECEIEDGCDFFGWELEVDWVIGNPPFRNKKEGENQIPLWVEKASKIANKGMAFLINHKVINFLTPTRLEKLKNKGFYLQKIHIVSDKRWFGRYYYLIFGRENKNFISWNIKTY